MQSPVNSAWFSEKEAEVTAHPKRGRKRSVVDKERRELAKKVLLVAHDRLESWERVAQFYGLSKAAAYRIAKDNAYRPSKAMLNSIIETDIPMVRQIPVAPCPSCAARGIVRSHGDKLDCNGNGGTAVVLADGETVRRNGQQRKRPTVRRPWMGAELSQEMDAAGVTDETVRWLVTRYIFEQEEE